MEVPEKIGFLPDKEIRIVQAWQVSGEGISEESEEKTGTDFDLQEKMQKSHHSPPGIPSYDSDYTGKNRRGKEPPPERSLLLLFLLREGNCPGDPDGDNHGDNGHDDRVA
jgi:hypothetical protein